MTATAPLPGVKATATRSKLREPLRVQIRRGGLPVPQNVSKNVFMSQLLEAVKKANHQRSGPERPGIQHRCLLVYVATASRRIDGGPYFCFSDKHGEQLVVATDRYESEPVLQINQG